MSTQADIQDSPGPLCPFRSTESATTTQHSRKNLSIQPSCGLSTLGLKLSVALVVRVLSWLIERSWSSWPAGATAMNIFRLIGDLLHLLSIFLLLWKLKKSKSCVGVSCRMQEIYLLVFATRYMDLLWSFVSVYNTTMKVIFLTSTAYLIFLMRVQPPISQTYDKQADNFPYLQYLVLPAAILSLITTESYYFTEVLWTFSIWLESVAIMPQLVLLQQLREVENLTSNYVAAMGLYRAFYILNWVYRYHHEGYVNWIGWIGGLVQVALYLDFFYYYAVSKWYGQKLILPFVQDVC